MSTSQPRHSEPRATGRLKRRGLVTAGVALLGGLLAKATGRVEAQSNPSWLLNSINSSTGATELDYNGAPGNPTLVIRNPSNDGIQSVASGSLSYGVWGDNGAGFGVVGTSSSGTGVSAGSTSGPGLASDSNSGTGVYGTSDTGVGVQGISLGAGANTAAHGVYGETSSTATGANMAVAVYGNNKSTSTATSGSGVVGNPTPTPGAGVTGNSTTGVGVRGNGGASGASAPIGVLGVSDTNPSGLSTPSTGAGVYGLSNSATAGVIGQSSTGYGVYGSASGTGGVGLCGTSTSATGAGIVASTNTCNAIQGSANANVGVLGSSSSSIGGYFSSSTSTGLYATVTTPGYAARFDGPVLVNGNFTVVGGSKSAAVPVGDGSYRLLYCVESPESWFEDFGTATLASGRATVPLAPDFAAAVLSDNYRVFLTPAGSSNGLFVASRTPTGFVVQEQNGGTSSVAFDYRIVAKRKDITAPRLAPVTIPPAPQPPPRIVPPAPLPEPGTVQTAADTRSPSPGAPTLPAGVPTPPRPTAPTRRPQ